MPVLNNSRAISIVIPAYNEEQRLPQALAEITSYFDECGDSYEIIVVDDGSTDRTVDVARAAATANVGVRILSPPHRGKGHAVRQGILAATGSSIVFCDADLPVPVADIRRLAGCLAEHQVAIGSREGAGAQRIGEPHYRHIMGRVFNFVVSLLAVPGVRDTQCGLKAFRATEAREIFSRQTIDGFGFDVEVLFIARSLGYQMTTLPVVWLHRPSSHVNPVRDTLRMLGDVLRVRWGALRRQYIRPIHSGHRFDDGRLVVPSIWRPKPDDVDGQG